MVIRSYYIDNFIRKVILSKARRKLHFKEGDKIPKKYSNDDHKFKNGILYSDVTNEKIIKNPNVAGKPRYQKISGNAMWAGMNYNLRAKIATEMKKFFYEYFRGSEPLNEEDYPIGVKLTITDNLSGRKGEDIDNMAYLYRKNIHDALCGNVMFDKVIENGKARYVPNRELYPALIEDDNRDFITEIITKIIVDEDLTDEETSILVEIYTIDD